MELGHGGMIILFVNHTYLSVTLTILGLSISLLLLNIFWDKKNGKNKKEKQGKVKKYGI